MEDTDKVTLLAYNMTAILGFSYVMYTSGVYSHAAQDAA